MKTKNHAEVIDSQGVPHDILCDYLYREGESVMLFEDHRNNTSNRTEMIAYFFRPIKVELIQENL